MTVAELIHTLKEMPEDLEVVFPDYCPVTKVVRVIDMTLPKKWEETVVLTDEGAEDDMVYN